MALLFFFRRELLIFLPLLLDFLPLLGRQLLQGLELRPGRAAFIRGQASPSAHLLLYALLLVGRHVWIALNDAQPLLLALGVELVPFRRERSEHLLVVRGEVRPIRRACNQRP